MNVEIINARIDEIERKLAVLDHGDARDSLEAQLDELLDYLERLDGAEFV